MPPCNDCLDKVVGISSIYAAYSEDCQEPDANCGTKALAQCVTYKGPNLQCSGVNTDDNLEQALQKLDTKLCSVVGDYSSYNKACLSDNVVITTEKDFVETISSEFCTLKGTVNSFINTTFPLYQTTVTNQINSILNPGITCTTANITPADSLATVFGKYCVKFNNIETKTNISSVNWSSCFSVPTAPTNIGEAFDLIISQICAVKAQSGVADLPTFNNVGSCLSGTLTTADTLVDTVNKIKAKVCTAPSFDINALTWGCLTKPSNVTTNLQDAFQVVLNKLTTVTQNVPTYSNDFVVEALDISNPCAGKVVKLASSPFSDRLVAATPTDTSGGTLIEKLQAGLNISLDSTTTPGKIIVAATGGAATDEKTKASAVGTAGYLDQKITGGAQPNGISISTPYDSGQDKIVVTPEIDWPVFIDKILDVIKDTPALMTKFCAIVKSCPSPCSAPSNIEVTFEP